MRYIIATFIVSLVLTVGTVGTIAAVRDAENDAVQSAAIDAAGDQDGTAEYATVNGERITEISIRFDCETMGNKTCGN